MIAFGAVSGAPIFHPSAVLAASGMVSVETPLHDSPDPAAPVIALLPEGTIISIGGPPVDGFYPVTAGDRSGWIRGESLHVEKDLAESDAGEEMAVDAPHDKTDETVPADSSPELDPALSTTVEPAADPAVDASAATEASAPAPVDASAPASAIPVAEVAPVGPASVAVDAPILAGPGPEYGFIATVPAGSTVEQTGHVINGYATVQYAEVTGWVALEHLGVSDSFVAETPPNEAAAVAEPPPVESPPAESPLVDPAPAETPLVETPIAETSPAATVSVAATPSDAPPVEAAPIAAT